MGRLVGQFTREGFRYIIHFHGLETGQLYAPLAAGRSLSWSVVRPPGQLVRGQGSGELPDHPGLQDGHFHQAAGVLSLGYRLVKYRI